MSEFDVSQSGNKFTVLFLSSSQNRILNKPVQLVMLHPPRNMQVDVHLYSPARLPRVWYHATGGARTPVQCLTVMREPCFTTVHVQYRVLQYSAMVTVHLSNDTVQ